MSNKRAIQSLLPFLFLLFTLGIFAGAIIYLSNRMSLFFQTEYTWFWIVSFSLLCFYMIGGLLLFTNSLRFWGSILYQLAALSMGVLLYLLMSTLLVDFSRLFIKASPASFGLALWSLTIFSVAFGIWNAFQIRISPIKIHLDGLQKNMKVAHLSDVHLGHFRGRKFLQKIVDKTNLQNPDLICITGDLFDGRIMLNRNVLMPLKDFKAPVYFVEGNHDGYSGVNEIKTYLRELGVQVLENEVKYAKEVQIIGLNHMRADSLSSGMHTTHGPTIKETLNSLSIKPDLPTILLHHSPDGIEYASEHGIDLYLAGHTHAGQMFPIIYLTNLIFKHNKGLHSFNHTKILVSQGIGTFGPPMRIGTKSEIIIIDLFSNS